MIRTELGKKTLICDITRKSALYINQLKLNPKSLANQALQYESENNDDSNIFQLVRTFTPFYRINQENQEFIQTINKRKIQKQNDAFYNQIWKTDIAKLSKAESYLQYKDNIRMEKYLTSLKNTKHRKALTRLRLSCHPLMIEKGRHRKPPLERSERKCPFCKSLVESELHFIVTCPKYENERTLLFRACTENSIHFEVLSNESKFIFIMSNEDMNISSALGSYTFNCMKLREVEINLLQPI